MTYKVGGVAFLLEPTSARWLPRTSFGEDGNGHPIYSAYRQYEFDWGINSPAQYNQIQTWFESVNITGSAVVDLPKYGDTTYTFQSYSGCVLREPEPNSYFVENITSVKWVITQIRT